MLLVRQMALLISVKFDRCNRKKSAPDMCNESYKSSETFEKRASLLFGPACILRYSCDCRWWSSNAVWLRVVDRVDQRPDDVQGIGECGIPRRGSASSRAGVEIRGTGCQQRPIGRRQGTRPTGPTGEETRQTDVVCRDFPGALRRRPWFQSDAARVENLFRWWRGSESLCCRW